VKNDMLSQTLVSLDRKNVLSNTESNFVFLWQYI